MMFDVSEGDETDASYYGHDMNKSLVWLTPEAPGVGGVTKRPYPDYISLSKCRSKFPMETETYRQRYYVHVPEDKVPRLSGRFLSNFKRDQEFASMHGILSDITVYDKYSRLLPDGSKETWFDICRRVVESTALRIVKHMRRNGLPEWDALQLNMELAFKVMFERKVIPAGRIVWGMGTEIMNRYEVSDMLYNCAFVSTGTTPGTLLAALVFLMYRSMLGSGVGIDLDASGKVFVKGQCKDSPVRRCEIQDSREGWVDSTMELVASYLYGLPKIEYVYDRIREKGVPIKGTGGQASGPGALKELHQFVKDCLDRCVGRYIDTLTLADIINYIGKTVCSGNMRRNAIIIIGQLSDRVFLDLKNYDLYPERASYGWTSNNSCMVFRGDDLSEALQRSKRFAEPGFLFIDNVRGNSCMGTADELDRYVQGINPCGEQPLESFEVCCLVECMMHLMRSLDEFKCCMQAALFFGKGVMLCTSLWEPTNTTIMANRRIGVGVAGVLNFIADHGRGNYKLGKRLLSQWLEAGLDRLKYFDRHFSREFGVRESTRLTTVKPGGTVPLVGGCLSGISPAVSRFILQRVRFSKTNELLGTLAACGYHIEDDVTDPGRRVVVSFPIDFGEHVVTVDKFNADLQMDLITTLQRCWSQNSVSCTVMLTPEEQDRIEHYAALAAEHCKAISFMPVDCSQYPQLPKQAITESEFHEAMAAIKSRPQLWSFAKDRSLRHTDALVVVGCDSDRCTMLSSVESLS